MHLFRSRPFALLFVGYALNAIGSWAALMAMWGFASYRFHADAGQVALIGLAWAVPSALLSPLAGVPIDRLGPRRVLVAAYGLGSATSLAMAFAGSLHALILLGLLHGTVEAFARPAGDALPPRLVDDADLLAANALLGSAAESAIAFGPLLAAGAIALTGLRGAFVVDAATFWIGMAAVAPLQLRPVRTAGPRPEAGLRQELAEGVRVARRSPVVRFTLALSAAVFLTWSTFMVIEPLYVRDVLHRSPTVFSLLQTAFGVGLVGTGLLLPRLGDRVASTRALSGSVLLSGLAAATYIGTHSVAVAFVGVFLWGVDVAFYSAPSRTLLQRGSPVHTHGRVLALYRSLHSWSDVVALPLAAVVAGALGPRVAGLAIAAVAATAGSLGLAVGKRPALSDVVEPAGAPHLPGVTADGEPDLLPA
ncbi:MAG TPA: MFS transporter [Acidimicrobiales bacterium]|nr:MFS transporter [Acidimicrobiales bacterium]